MGAPPRSTDDPDDPDEAVGDDGPADATGPHWVDIDGHRWRATDPSIPSSFRQELFDELLRSRQAIALLKATGDQALVEHNRRQTHAAKVALGERGEPWWEPPTPQGRRARVEAAILALVGHRAPRSSICPSDAARAVGGDSWRDLMPVARDAARDLALAGDVVVTQGDQVLDPAEEWHGPIRIRLSRR